MRKRVWLCVLIIIMLALSACQLPPSQMLEQRLADTSITTPDAADTTTDDMPHTPVTTRVQKTLEGKTIKLSIDVDVIEYPGRQFGVYDARPIEVDHDMWYEFFFSGMTREELTHYYAGWGQAYLDRQEITDKEIENTFAYYYGDKNQPALQAYYLNNQALFLYTFGEPYDLNLEYEYTLSENQADKQQAELLSDEIMHFAAGDRFERTSCGVEQTDDGKKEVYVSYYHKKIESLPILLDAAASGTDKPDPIRIDGGEVWVIDGKVVYATAIIRDIEKRESSPVISLEQALGTLELFFDTVNAFTMDYIEGRSDKSEFDINRIELMYYPVLIEDAQIAQSYAGKRAYASYRPVWCIASGERIHTNWAFVMVIDAITGEVIG